MTKILIIGAGGHGQVIADIILSRSRLGERLELVGFLDDDPSLLGKEVLDTFILGSVDQVYSIPHDAVVVGIGHNQTRALVYERLRAQGEQFATLVHPQATLAQHLAIGAGTVVFAGAVINTGSTLGPNVIVNTGATVDHHARLGAHVHIAPGTHVGGTVTIGEGTFLGIGSCVIPNLTIGEWTIVGAGAAVTGNLPERVTAVGVPARIIKHHISTPQSEAKK